MDYLIFCEASYAIADANLSIYFESTKDAEFSFLYQIAQTNKIVNLVQTIGRII